LVRVTVVEVDGVSSALPDRRTRRPGRGASLHPDPVCLDLAQRRRAFPRALRHEGPLSITALQDVVAELARLGQHETDRQPKPEAGRTMRWAPDEHAV